jgi:sugar phosphate isomerase/epimerase
MFGLSTAWNFEGHRHARPMIEEIKEIGIDSVELNFKLRKETVDGVAKLVDEGFIKVLSLHNFCPVPESIEINKASPDYYSLASLDEDERKRAVSETKHTMDAAHRLKARAIVVHAGRLEIKDKTRALAKAVEDGMDPVILINAMQEEREEALKKGYLNRLLESIEGLLEHSKKTGIKIGLENRFYFRELPSIPDFEVIFDTFRDANICYWHDAGHAQVYENLRLLRHEDYLEKFGRRLLGVHLHDVRGIIDDHHAPFTGDLDFSILKPFLNKETIKILEPHARAQAEDIKIALERLKKLYGD